MLRHTGPGARLRPLQLLLCVTWARSWGAACPLPWPGLFIVRPRGPAAARQAEGWIVEQRDTVCRRGCHLGLRAQPPVAAERFQRTRQRRDRHGGGDARG